MSGSTTYAYVGNSPTNATDPSGLLFFFTQNAISRNPIPTQDAIRISNFTNAVGLAGTTVAASPFIAGSSILGGGAAVGSFAALSGTTFTTGAVVSSSVLGGATSALTALSLGGNGKTIAIAGGVGAVAGAISPGINVVGGLANMVKGAGFGGATSTITQGIDISTSSTKTLDDFSFSTVFGSAIGGGIGQGLTAPFGRSFAEQASAATLKFGFSTVGKGVGGALGAEQSYFGNLGVGGPGNQTLLGVSPR